MSSIAALPGCVAPSVLAPVGDRWLGEVFGPVGPPGVLPLSAPSMAPNAQTPSASRATMPTAMRANCVPDRRVAPRPDGSSHCKLLTHSDGRVESRHVRGECGIERDAAPRTNPHTNRQESAIRTGSRHRGACTEVVYDALEAWPVVSESAPQEPAGQFHPEPTKPFGDQRPVRTACSPVSTRYRASVANGPSRAHGVPELADQHGELRSRAGPYNESSQVEALQGQPGCPTTQLAVRGPSAPLRHEMQAHSSGPAAGATIRLASAGPR